MGTETCYNLLYVLIELAKQSYKSTAAVFNNAEESLQDGSHLYSTQHETASTYVHHSLCEDILHITNTVYGLL